MGQDQSEGMELEDKMVDDQPYGVTKTIKGLVNLYQSSSENLPVEFNIV